MASQDTHPFNNVFLSVKKSEDGESLHRYFDTKMYLAARIRRLRDLLKLRGSEARANVCLELQKRLAADRFLVAVAGQFKRGKSSLLNAIIGCELLPVGIVPLTSAITIVRYGTAPQIIVTYRNSSYEQKLPLSQLADYVTDKGNPANCKNVEYVRIEYPSSFLRRGVEFVDTPGIGSAIEANTATTMNFIPQCDAVIFVTSIDSPLTSIELGFLNEIKKWVPKIFFIINKIDLVATQEKVAVFSYVQCKISESLGKLHLRVYPLSARTGLETKISGNEQGYEDSGIKNFLEDLSQFLYRKRWVFFLTSVAGKALVPLEHELSELEIQRRASVLANKERNAWRQALHSDFARLASARRGVQEEMKVTVVQRLCQHWASHIDAFLVEQERQLCCRLTATCRSYPLKTWGLLADAVFREAELKIKDALCNFAEKHEEEALRLLNSLCAEFVIKLSTHFDAMRNTAAAMLGLAENRSADAHAPALKTVTLDKPWHTMEWPPLMCRLPRIIRAIWVLTGSKNVEKLLGSQLHAWLGAIGRSFADAVQKSVERVLANIADSMDKEAQLVESRFLYSPEAATGERHGTNVPEEDCSSMMRELRELRNDFVRFLTDDFGATAAAAHSNSLNLQRPLTEPVDSGNEAPINLPLDLGMRRCPVCCHMEKTLLGFLAKWQYRLATEPAAQAAFAREGGFCALHSWQLEGHSSPRGMSIGLTQLCELIARELIAGAESLVPTHQPQTVLLLYGRSCRVCKELAQAETNFCDSLMEYLATNEGRQAYICSEGVCLRHLERLIKLVPDEVSILLIRHASRRFLETAEDMRSYALKHDAICGEFINDREAGAYLRAINSLAGSRLLQTFWKKE